LKENIFQALDIMTLKQLEFVKSRLQSIQIDYYYVLYRIVKNFDV